MKHENGNGTEQPGLDFIVTEVEAGLILDRIRAESRSETEKGRWFENLFIRVARQTPEFELDGIWRWADWPDREAVTGLDGTDIGVDLVARRTSGEWIAVQCKCYAKDRVLPMDEIIKFLGGSQHEAFSLRWIVTTCRWGPNAERAIKNANPPVSRIDFGDHANVLIDKEDAERPVQEPWELQNEAIDSVTAGLENHDRGRLVMACGTGKTFTSLRIAERTVGRGGRILFAAPSIALVSQARREWLRLTVCGLECLVVCSDPTAGQNGREDIGLSELECPVTTDEGRIAAFLAGESDRLKVVFCTYQSLRRVTAAQDGASVPAFNLAIADEAHRTTGVLRDDDGKVDFQEFHRAERLRAVKRLYMTATPRIYTQRSKKSLASQGFETVDMGDQEIYGPEFYRLPFAKAVEKKMLSDYRVILLGVNESSVTPGLRGRLEKLHDSGEAPSTNEMTRVLGVSLAINGVTEGTDLERPGPLRRTLAFANSIDRSKWYAGALKESEVKRATTRRLKDGRAMDVVASHLDAKSSALERNIELRSLAGADRQGECRIISNVKLFTEGVDVPQLNAVAFLDPRQSQVDVVQAVGRVMRKAEGKRFGYIIVPVVIPPGKDIIEALERGTDGYSSVGKVLRALQSHDGRLAEDPARFVQAYDQPTPKPPPPDPGSTGDPGVTDPVREFRSQGVLALKQADEGIYAHVAASSGLGKPGLIVADEIADAVKYVSGVFRNEGVEAGIAGVLDLMPESDGGAKGVCTIAALMLCNACLLQRRLNDVPDLETERLDAVAGAKDPKEPLGAAWELILERDYAPVFRPALAVLNALPDRKATDDSIRTLAECANRVADSLSELGYDHAGPLYHRILGSAKSDGAFYTNNVSAVMLARLAFSDAFIDWSDPEAVGRLRIMDPACGTGTLLMAALRTIKDRVAESAGRSDGDHDTLHKSLVEDVLCGLDINRHGIQLAACNMTLGAPTVDYARMNLVTMPHGPQSDGSPKAGSLEILNAPATPDLRDMMAPKRDLLGLDAAQVDAAERIDFPLKDLDGVIMNAPFTDNAKRGRKFGRDARRRMQGHELDIRNYILERDRLAGSVITTNSISTFFSPLAEQLLAKEHGVLAKVIPVTACTGAGGVAERRFLADRFHVERIVTTHDPKRIAFSENTGIHECLLVCRRCPPGERPPTQFVSLRRMPDSAGQAIQAAEAVASGAIGDWGRVRTWPEARIRDGDWTPAQWYDGDIAETLHWLESHPALAAASDAGLSFGATGQAAQDSWVRVEHDPLREDQVMVFDSVSAKTRRTMAADPEQAVEPGGRRAHLWEEVLKTSGNLMLATRFDTQSGRLTALWSERATFGFGWIPAKGADHGHERAICAWWNSTPGRLLLLNRRAKKLTYPKWSKGHLESIPCPKPGSQAIQSLADAWRKACDRPMLPMSSGEDCEARRIIDNAAALALGVKPDEIRDWRCGLAKEPTVRNDYADVPTGS